MDAPTETARVCIEFNPKSVGDARGWRALVNDHSKPVIYCPHCAEREFRAPKTLPWYKDGRH